jgi:hypothetical protein
MEQQHIIVTNKRSHKNEENKKKVHTNDQIQQ